jgi:hypothetical protein
MSRKRLYLILLVIVVLAFPGSVGATVYDLKTDWSDTTNPNGPWTYNQGVTPLPLIADFIPGKSQPAWAWVPITSSGHTPIWLKAVENGIGGDVLLGDVVVHGTDPNNTNGSGEANVTWTSNLAGTAQISGNVWFAGGEGRSVDWYLQFNDYTLASGTVWDGDPWYRDHPFNFGTFSRTLAAGDVISFQTNASSGSVAHFVGVNLTIDAVPVPVPPAIWLFGSGLVGLIGLRRKVFK